MTSLKSRFAVQMYGCFSKSANISSVICGSVREIRQNRGKKSQFPVFLVGKIISVTNNYVVGKMDA